MARSFTIKASVRYATSRRPVGDRRTAGSAATAEGGRGGGEGGRRGRRVCHGPEQATWPRAVRAPPRGVEPGDPRQTQSSDAGIWIHVLRGKSALPGMPEGLREPVGSVKMAARLVVHGCRSASV